MFLGIRNEKSLLDLTYQTYLVAAAALFVWDYLVTMGMEIELVWTSRWNAIKILFLIQRYLPFLDTCILTLYRALQITITIHGRLVNISCAYHRRFGSSRS